MGALWNALGVLESSLLRVMVAEQVEAERLAERLVFVDEMGTNTSFCLLCMPGLRRARGLSLLSASQPRQEHHCASSSMSVEKGWDHR
jgi:hypothetical protein